ncbi:MAG TPA: sigma-70 family RNA polymerase sigma factor [Terriglobales bacterium]|nr:sigma-70 family RNA polymerase sigma factor [Terriglobales bacterium]
MSGRSQVSPGAFLVGLEELIQELFERSGGTRFGLTIEEFTVILGEVSAKSLPPDASRKDAQELLTSLRVEDLALARACAGGREAAWEHFLTRFREKLYDSARAITHEESQARELADSIYADLYGLTTREGERPSKLNSYTGRGSLEGWLRTVLAQEFINRYRGQRRLVSLEEQEEEFHQTLAPAPPVAPEGGSGDARLDAAVDEALGSLSPEDRALLAAYFLDGRTLAEIGRMMGFHEATASRKLDKLAKTLRKAVRDGLTRRGMSRRQADEAMETDVRDLRVNVRKRLSQEGSDSTF